MSARSLGTVLGFLPANNVSYRKGNFNGRVNCPDKNYIVASQHMYCLSTEFWSLCTGLIEPILLNGTEFTMFHSWTVVSQLEGWLLTT